MTEQILKKRTQLTLFVDGIDSASIEEIRKEFNPVQYELIKAHVTLCREDELRSIEKVIENLSALNYSNITIHFGVPIRFADGKGVLIPATGGNEQFHNLRKIVLSGIIHNLQKQEPHITLMHPRNSTCTGIIFEEIKKVRLPDKLTFRKISLIEQEEGKEWNILKEFDLKEYI